MLVEAVLYTLDTLDSGSMDFQIPKRQRPDMLKPCFFTEGFFREAVVSPSHSASCALLPAFDLFKQGSLFGLEPGHLRHGIHPETPTPLQLLLQVGNEPLWLKLFDLVRGRVGLCLQHSLDAFEKASNAELKPVKLTDTMAFMFETRFPQKVSRFAATTDRLQDDYIDCWGGLKKQFDGTPGAGS